MKYPFIFLLLIFYSCTPEPLDLHIIQHPSKMVVNTGYTRNSDAFSIVISRSFSILNKDYAEPNSINEYPKYKDLIVDSAQVFLSQGELKYELENGSIIDQPGFYYLNDFEKE